MKKLTIFIIFLSFHAAVAQRTAIVKFEQIQKTLTAPSDQIQVINFWATWCAPCVKELPLFEQLNAKNDPAVKITLVSLDFAEKVEKVNAFVTKKNIKSEVLLLDEIDYNTWIDKVDKSWEGAIPATLVINTKTGKRKFLEKELAEGDLEKMIQEVQ